MFHKEGYVIIVISFIIVAIINLFTNIFIAHPLTSKIIGIFSIAIFILGSIVFY